VGVIGHGEAVELVAETIGYGIVGGMVAGAAAAVVVVHAGRRSLIDAHWRQVVRLAPAGLAFGLAEAIGGSGLIAAFVAGGVFGGLRSGRGGEVSHLVEEAGSLLAAVTFVVFGPGAPRADALRPHMGSRPVPVLSLTLVRMLPVTISMLGTGARRPTVAFLGWFGPRGAASIVFALLVIEERGLPGEELPLTTAFVTIGLSVFAHGISAAPLAARYADWFVARTRTERTVEASGGSEVRWRLQKPADDVTR